MMPFQVYMRVTLAGWMPSTRMEVVFFEPARSFPLRRTGPHRERNDVSAAVRR